LTDFVNGEKGSEMVAKYRQLQKVLRFFSTIVLQQFRIYLEKFPGTSRSRLYSFSKTE